MKDNRKRYVDKWYEDCGGKPYRYSGRRKLRHFERDLRKLGV